MSPGVLSDAPQFESIGRARAESLFMIRRAPFTLALAVLLLVSPPARAPTMRAVRALDVDPLLGPWPVETLLLPHGDFRAESPASILLRPAVDRLHQAWASLRSLADRAAPALRAVERVLSTPVSTAPASDPDAVFMRRYFDDLFRPQTAGLAAPGGSIDLADIFVKLTAIAFVGALVLVPAGCSSASAGIYGRS
jgi:hypothetical protein